MTKFAVRIAGEDSSRVFETAAENESLEALAKRLVENGFLLGRMKTSERTPEPEEVAITASQVRWLALAPATRGGSRF